MIIVVGPKWLPRFYNSFFMLITDTVNGNYKLPVLVTGSLSVNEIKLTTLIQKL